MRSKNIIILLVLILALGLWLRYSGTKKNSDVNAGNPNSNAGNMSQENKIVNMKIESSAFENNGMIPAKYTCDGQNINPPLKISDVPQSAKSLALVIDDPDAPKGTWIHWVVMNINPMTKEISEHSVPKGAKELKTSFGKLGYGGPCPPSGTHRYFFKLYALGGKIEKVEDIPAYTIAKTELIGLYSKK